MTDLTRELLINYGYTVQRYMGTKFLLFDAGNCSAGFAADTEEEAWESGLVYLNKYPGNVTRAVQVDNSNVVNRDLRK